MSPLFKTLEGVLVIVGALGLGYLARHRGWLSAERSSPISRAGLTYLSPVVIALVLWALVLPGWSVAALPVICALLILLAWPLSSWLGRGLFSAPRDRAPWILCSMFSNQGTTYGAFLCYLLLGVQGAALASFFCLPFAPLVYLLGFYIAGRYVEGALSPWAALGRVFRASYSRNPLLATGLGLLLLAFAPRLPLFGHRAIEVLVPLDAAIQLFAIGLSLRLSRVAAYLRPVVVMHVFKFLLLPLLGLGMAWALGLWGQANHEMVKVVFIEACTPVAILSLVVAQVSGLNRHLANSLWVTTNLFAVVWAPVTLLIARSL